MKWITVLILAVLLIAPSAARARTLDDLPVYVITFGPGAEPWEKFGHVCISIGEPDGTHVPAYNWGVFDFGQGVSGFVTFGGHFLQGKLMYAMDAYDSRKMVEEYEKSGRSVLIQQLRLTPQQKQNLIDRLYDNDTDEKRLYLYDYFRKNCSTMARDAIDQTIDGRVAATLKSIPTTTTYRWHDRRESAEQIWLYVFLDDVLGHEVDKPLSAWDESFLPGKLAEHLRLVQVPDGHGHAVPLVMSEKLLNAGTIPDRASPPNFFFGFLATGVIGAGILAVLGFFSTRHWVARWAFNLLVMGWSLLTGLMGALLTYAWFSNHDAAKWNENWLQNSPLSLVLILLVPMAWRWPRAARIAAIAVFACSAIGLVAKVTPWFWQTNGAIIAGVLPIQAAVAWGVYRRTIRLMPKLLKSKPPVGEALRAA